MKKTYRVERMTVQDWLNKMQGGYNYKVEHIDIEAENKEEAIEKAEIEDYIVNKEYVKTVDEINTQIEESKKFFAEQKAKEQKAKEKRLATEMKKANDKGMTVEEYRQEKAKIARMHRLEKEIAELEKELTRKKNALNKIRG